MYSAFMYEANTNTCYQLLNPAVADSIDYKIYPQDFPHLCNISCGVTTGLDDADPDILGHVKDQDLVCGIICRSFGMHQDQKLRNFMLA